jgi:hypothetical protein
MVDGHPPSAIRSKENPLSVYATGAAMGNGQLLAHLLPMIALFRWIKQRAEVDSWPVHSLE